MKFVGESRSRQRKATPPPEEGGERGTEKKFETRRGDTVELRGRSVVGVVP